MLWGMIIKVFEWYRSYCHGWCGALPSWESPTNMCWWVNRLPVVIKFSFTHISSVKNWKSAVWQRWIWLRAPGLANEVGKKTESRIIASVMIKKVPTAFLSLLNCVDKIVLSRCLRSEFWWSTEPGTKMRAEKEKCSHGWAKPYLQGFESILYFPEQIDVEVHLKPHLFFYAFSFSCLW